MKTPSSPSKDKGKSSETLSDGTPKVTCFKCKGYGHYKKDCPTTKSLTLHEMKETNDYQHTMQLVLEEAASSVKGDYDVCDPE